jgi:hypothetical protein
MKTVTVAGDCFLSVRLNHLNRIELCSLDLSKTFVTETGLKKTIQIIHEGASSAALQLHLVAGRASNLPIETGVARIEVISGEPSGLKRDPRQAYLNIKNIID